MSKPGSIEQHHDAIVAMRAAGKTAREIGATLGISTRGINRYAHRANLPPKPRKEPKCKTRRLSVPIGSVYITRHLTPDELRELDRCAAQWGCATMAEAAVEILKDALAEQQAREAAE